MIEVHPRADSKGLDFAAPKRVELAQDNATAPGVTNWSKTKDGFSTPGMLHIFRDQPLIAGAIQGGSQYPGWKGYLGIGGLEDLAASSGNKLVGCLAKRGSSFYFSDPVASAQNRLRIVASLSLYLKLAGFRSGEPYDDGLGATIHDFVRNQDSISIAVTSDYVQLMSHTNGAFSELYSSLEFGTEALLHNLSRLIRMK